MIRDITGDNIELTEALKDSVNEHLDKILHFNDKLTRADVILKQENNDFKAEITVSVPHSNNIHADASGDDMYLAIEAVTNKIVGQLRKIKVKNESKRRH